MMWVCFAGDTVCDVLLVSSGSHKNCNLVLIRGKYKFMARITSVLTSRKEQCLYRWVGGD